jgi:hypothetical protein
MALRPVCGPWLPRCRGFQKSEYLRGEDVSHTPLQLLQHQHFLQEWHHFHFVLSLWWLSVVTWLSRQLKHEGNYSEYCEKYSRSTFRITGALCDGTHMQNCVSLPSMCKWRIRNIRHCR